MNHSTQHHQKPAQASSKAMIYSEKPSKAKAQQPVLEKSPAYPVGVCRTLHRLTTKLHVFKSRVEFVVLAFKHGLVSDITSYDL